MSEPTSEHAELVAFYEDSYAKTGAEALLYSRWRGLGALGKADHVIELCSREGILPMSTLEVGCGDGALLCELHARGFGGSLHGVEITRVAVEIAGAREQIDSVELYDGEHLDSAEQEHELGIVSHVLEHVPDPVALLTEVARACEAVVVEVPLEDNLSARRAGKRAHAQEVGHLQRLSRSSVRAIVTEAGLQIEAELQDALPVEAHLFFAESALARARARLKWAVRAAMHRIAPALARRLFTVHYACLCMARAE